MNTPQGNRNGSVTRKRGELTRRSLDAYGVAKLNVAGRLPAANANVLRGKFMKPNEYALRRNSKGFEPLHNPLIEAALGIDGAPWEDEDADVRQPLWIRAVEASDESRRLMDRQRDVSMNWKNAERFHQRGMDGFH